MDRPRRPRLERLLRERVALNTRLDDRCAKLLAQLRKQCPGAVPPTSVDPGKLADPVVLKGEELTLLLRAALPSEADGDGAFLLVEGDKALIVDPSRCRILTADGIILVVLGVECDQTGPTEVTVGFGVGSEQAVTGMIATTEPSPRGPAVIVTAWAEALIALAWEALMSVLAGVTRHLGTDSDRAPLLPGALTATRGSISVVPQARHEADRLAPR